MRIDNAGIHRGHKGLSLHKQLQALHDVRCGLRQHLADDLVAAGGLPERLGAAVVVEITDDRPGVEDLTVSKTVAVVPIAKLLVLLRHPVIGRHLLDFLRGKAKVFAVTILQDRVHFQIIEAAEDAFLGNTEDAGQKTVAQVTVVFQATGKEVAHKADDGIIKAIHMALLDGCIVFINDNNGRDTVMLVQQTGQGLQ